MSTIRSMRLSVIISFLVLTPSQIEGSSNNPCPDPANIPDPFDTSDITDCNLPAGTTDALVCQLDAFTSTRLTESQLVTLAEYLKVVTTETSCQCSSNSQCKNARGDSELGNGFTFAVVFVNDLCGEGGLRSLGENLVKTTWNHLSVCNDLILIMFSQAAHWVELGSLASDFIESELRDDVVRSIQDKLDNNETYPAIVEFIVEELMPVLKTEFDAWMWIIIGVAGLIAAVLLVLALVGVICYMKISSKKGAASRGRSSRQNLDTTPFYKPDRQRGQANQALQYASDSD